ncbi:MAG: S1C family serine protease [Traorella sp.]
MENDFYENKTNDGTYRLVKEKEPKKKKTNKFLWILLCAIVGFAGGLGGSALAFTLMGGSVGHNTDIIYQSVIQSDEDGNQITQLSAKDLVANVKDSVVEITTSTINYGTFMGQYVSSGAGSGVVFSENGLIVTNHHVIDGASEIKVKTTSGEEYDATLIASDSQTDLAVLRIDATGLKPAVLGDSDIMSVGDTVYAIGNPLGSLGGTVTNGILSAKDREITIDGQDMILLQTSAAVNPGNSGGGLFNDKGELIGIVNAKSSGSDIEGIGFAIPINIAKDIVTDLVETGKVSGRLVLGINYYEISNLSMATKYGVNTLGLLIAEVSPNSNAERAGLKAKDVIVEVDGEQVTTSEDLKNALNSHKVGDTMKFCVVRDKEYVELSVVLED